MRRRVDADNRLPPNAIEDLVTQLRAAPRNVGFVYPNLEFFGNRHDYVEVPSYNLFTLLHGNYCDTCSLLDRNIFEAGLFYPEGVFREDWHFVLTLADRKITLSPPPAPPPA